MSASRLTGNHGQFDDTLPDAPTVATREYGWSQKNAGDGSTPSWQDAPVLRTDQSFTVTTTVYMDALDTTMTAIAPKGNKQSAFYLGTRKSTVNGVAAHRFEIMVPSADADVGETYVHVIAPEALAIDDAGVWHQLTVVYDGGTRVLKLYVNGVIKAKTTLAANLWQANGSMVVGSSWYTPDQAAGTWTDRWYGGIDEISVYQGAMTDAQVAHL